MSRETEELLVQTRCIAASLIDSLAAELRSQAEVRKPEAVMTMLARLVVTLDKLTILERKLQAGKSLFTPLDIREWRLVHRYLDTHAPSRNDA